MQKKNLKKMFQQVFYSHYKTPVHADGLFGIIVLFVTAVVL